MKKIFAVLLSMVLVLSINHTAYGLSVTSMDTNTVNRDDIIDFGEKFIKENIGRSYDSTWTEETCMSEIIETKDADGNLNGIITNLTTNKNETGYVVIDAFSKDSMNVSEFGYDGKYYITDDNIINNVSLDNVINLGDRNYFTKKNDVLYSVETNQPIQVNKDVLREEYKSQINIDELNCKDNEKT